jgi:uncharacterized membrane protein
MKRLLQSVVLLATAAGVAWWYWKSSNQANADAWAAGTDSVD